MINVEGSRLWKDASEIPVLFSSSEMKDKDGSAICIICTGREISDHKVAKTDNSSKAGVN